MPDVLVRGLAQDVVDRLDRRAESEGRSRAEMLREALTAYADEVAEVEADRPVLTREAARRFGEAVKDLRDPAFRAALWNMPPESEIPT